MGRRDGPVAHHQRLHTTEARARASTGRCANTSVKMASGLHGRWARPQLRVDDR